MKTKLTFAVLTIVSVALFSSISQAADITATGSGNWSSTNADMPWPGGIVPGTNDSVDVEAPLNVTVNTNTTVGYIYGSGTVTMGAGTTLTVLGDNVGAYGTQTLGLLDTSASSNTVIYTGNSYHAKRQNYCNLVFSNSTTNPYDFYNGGIPGYPATPMTVSGDMTVMGKIKVQQGADFTIGGGLNIGTNSTWDCSSFRLTVAGPTTMSGLLIDLDGALGSNYFGGGITINASAAGGWNVSDVTQWAVCGNLTNNGLIAGGKGYGSITFFGAGIITGKPFKIPTLTINGTDTIDTTITLTTNTPTLNGTLVFDIAKTNQIILQSFGTNLLTLYYSGILDVINSGAAPVSGKSYKFFNATYYDGAFSSTSFPSLASGFSWVDNMVLNGSITLTGASAGFPILRLSQNAQLLTLSWDSATFPGYSVLAQTNQAGIGTLWSSTGSGTVSPYTVTVNPANPPVFYRLSHP